MSSQKVHKCLRVLCELLMNSSLDAIEVHIAFAKQIY